MGRLIRPARFAASLGSSGSLYWRVKSSEIGYSQSQCQLSEVEMALVAGGADQCTGGTVIYSDQVDGTTNAAANAFDDNTSTVWTTNNGNAGGWIGYQFATPKDIQEVRLRASSNPNRYPRSFTIESSNDGSTWTIRQYVVGQWTVQASESRSFNVPTVRPGLISGGNAGTAHYYWRLYSYGTTAQNLVSLAEIEFAETTSGTNLCAGGFSFATDNYPNANEVHPRAFNGNNSDHWTTNLGITTAGIGYALSVAKCVKEMRVRYRNDGYLGAGPSKLKLQYSDDLQTWADAYDNASVAAWSSGEQRTYTNPSAP